MDNIVEWLVDENSGFAMQWYGLSDEQQVEFKNKFQNIIVCEIQRIMYNHL